MVSHVVIGLRTVKGTKQLKLDPTIYDAMQKEKVRRVQRRGVRLRRWPPEAVRMLPMSPGIQGRHCPYILPYITYKIRLI